MGVELTLSSYIADVTRPLMDGAVEPDGIDLRTVVEYPPDRHRRFFEHGDFDVAEVSLASYLVSRQKPDSYPFTAIPVFPERKFRHAFVYVRGGEGIDSPADLEGKNVGIQSWQTTANVWMRGIAAEQYGLDLEEVRWYRRRGDDAAMEVPDRYELHSLSDAEEDDDPTRLVDRLATGELDAVMDPAGEAFAAVVESEDMRLLFDDPLEEEAQYYRKTGIFPPMHTVAIRDEVLTAHPWVAQRLYDSFVEAKRRCFERSRSPSAYTSLVWPHLLYKKRQEVLDDDAWAYGLGRSNRAALEKFVEYMVQQGLLDGPIPVRDLFSTDLLDRSETGHSSSG